MLKELSYALSVSREWTGCVGRWAMVWLGLSSVGCVGRSNLIQLLPYASVKREIQ
jgi:hypothetical protein